MFISDQLRQFFMGKAISQPPPAASQTIQLTVPDEDDPESVDARFYEGSSNEDANDLLGFAEGQSFLIEYVDSKGNSSTRRITVWGIKAGTSCPLLVAQCHERNAKRSFRIDRIQAIFDFDGVLQEPLADFFIETFGMPSNVIHDALRSSDSIPRPAQVPNTTPVSNRWNQVRRICRDRGVPLLCLIARADSDFHETELNVIGEYAHRCCTSESINLSPAERDRLAGYIERLRPTPTSTTKCLDKAATWNNKELSELLEACAHVVKADGRVMDSEVAELAFIVNSTTGHELF